MNDNIDRRDLCSLVHDNLKVKIDPRHVIGVIGILIEEIINDLKNNKKLIIHNLGTIYLKPTPTRMSHNIANHVVMQSPGYKVLRFTLQPKLRKKLMGAIDKTTLREYFVKLARYGEGRK